ncbi:MAG: hypothetical protein WBN96_09150 [Gammaproteobacteria bacterium]
MAQFNKISTTLSIAATVLVQACSSSATDSGPTPVANTTAPELVGEWRSDCTNTPSPKSSPATITYAKASGGGGGSGGGESQRDTIIFNQNGRAEFSTEYYATANCNTSTLASVDRVDYVYFVGNATTANDSSVTTELDYSSSSATLYSMFQVVNGGIDLHLGDSAQSAPGNDGISPATRLDGLGDALRKQ